MVGFTGNGVITGGTGRFEGATGSWTGTGTQNYYLDPEQAQEIWYNWTEGTITY
jgi:hypothetical protein